MLFVSGCGKSPEGKWQGEADLTGIMDDVTKSTGMKIDVAPLVVKIDLKLENGKYTSNMSPESMATFKEWTKDYMGKLFDGMAASNGTTTAKLAKAMGYSSADEFINSEVESMGIEDMIKEIAVLTNKIKIDKHDKIIIKMFQSYLIETLIEDEKTQDELSELVNMENTAIGRYIERKEREIEEKWEEKGKVIEQQWKIKENEQQQKWKNKENEQQQKWKNKENEQQQKWKIKEAELKENQKKNLFESARKMLLDNIPDNKIVKYLSIHEDDLMKIKLDIAAK